MLSALCLLPAASDLPSLTVPTHDLVTVVVYGEVIVARSTHVARGTNFPVGLFDRPLSTLQTMASTFLTTANRPFILLMTHVLLVRVACGSQSAPAPYEKAQTSEEKIYMQAVRSSRQLST